MDNLLRLGRILFVVLGVAFIALGFLYLFGIAIWFAFVLFGCGIASIVIALTASHLTVERLILAGLVMSLLILAAYIVQFGIP